MTDYQIECISLCKEFKRDKHILRAVDNVDLAIMKNEMVIIKGRSGAGKSTLLNLMSGLLEPSSGKVLINNMSVNDLSNDALSNILLNQIGIIFQSFNLLPTYTVFENIEIGVVPKNLDQKLVNENITLLLEQFGLKQYSKSRPSELSVGQQQKVAIIRTLMKQPSIIFADEPTGSVDEQTADEILEHLVSLKKEKQVTLVMATHGNSIEKLADRVITIENGRIKTDNA
jgi:ABC-type lipoprotein export system ATPase subunit